MTRLNSQLHIRHLSPALEELKSDDEQRFADEERDADRMAKQDMDYLGSNYYLYCFC